ncbi:AlpA family phage regulatory protein [Deefgea piscis]|uniref:AlpA family phage regulatory protein n=1 Tax=Deefgea piscis TaxID=2739061 RepID=A0A6M8STB3_9NEIS|nr:AlpA family phage regulatory protein [Deefgea piscis]
MKRKETAKFLSMSADTLDRRVKNDPTFPKHYKIGRIKFWYLDEIESWLKTKRSV